MIGGRSLLRGSQTATQKVLAYGLAIVFVALLLILCGFFGSSSTSLFFLAVMVSAWYGGLGPGLVATVLSTLAINYCFVEPYYTLKLIHLNDAIRLGVFVAVALLISGLNDARWMALRREQQLRSISEVAQQEAQAVKVRLERVLSSISDGVYTLDHNWRCTYANDRLCEMAGKPRAELLNRNIWEFFPDTVDTDLYGQFQRAMVERVLLQFEYHYPAWQRWFEYRVYPSDQGLTIFVAEVTNRKQTEAALQVRETDFRAMFNLTSVGMAQADSQTRRFLRVNAAFCKITGYSEAELLTCRIEDLSHPEDRNRDRDRFIGLVQRVATAYQSEKRYLRKDGSIVWVLVTGNVIEAEGQPGRVVAVVQDITDRKRSETALQKSEERFRLVTQAVNGLIFDWNLQTNEVYRSDKLYDLIGIHPEAVPPEATAWHERVHPDDLARLNPYLAELMASACPLYEMEYRIRHADGRWIDLKEQGCVIRDDRGNVTRIVGCTVDISERKQAAEALRRSEERLRVSQELSLDAFTILDSVRSEAGEIIDFTWTYVNPKAGEILNHPAADLVGQRLLEVLPGNAGNCELFQRYMRVVETGEPHDIELAYTTDGIDGWFRNMAVKLDDGVAVFFSDITDRKQAEAEREDLLQAAQAARQDAEEANRIKDEFLAVVSHELRSPLNPILGWSKLLRKQSLTHQQTERALQVIERNAQMQAQLINDLLDVSRILRGKLSLEQHPVDLISTIEAAMETVRLAAEAKAIQMHTQIESDLGPVLGDAGRLQQVLWNLLSNAIKFTPNGGHVTVRLEQTEERERTRETVEDCQSDGGQGPGARDQGPGIRYPEPDTQNLEPEPQNPNPKTRNLIPDTCPTRYAQITVTDTGKGIAPNFLPYVFDHFRQESFATTRRFGGLGLGLAIVRYLVEMHGGTVQADSPGDGQGATFSVTLPLLARPATVNLDAPAADSAFDLTGTKILVVDDDDNTREFVAFFLDMQGATVQAVATAAEALATLSEFQPNLLLSDIGMPDVDGYMLMRQIRALPPEQGGTVLAIALTAYAGELDYQQAMAVGFQQHLAKPVEPQQLMDAIAKLRFSGQTSTDRS